ncbi:MAG: hypothetical protein RBQ91_02570 [Acholeplasma sp.]|nr:hypothetical protein [Acholeplasma sp.]
MKLKVLYGCFILYTMVHLVFFFGNENQIVESITLKADPIVLALFSLMGLFPLWFFVSLSRQYQLAKKDYLYLVTSFFIGAYALTPFFFHSHVEKPYKKSFKTIDGLFLMVFLIILAYGFIFGDVQTYFQWFQSDSFIHIMTLDFLLLLVLSIHKLKQTT